jgi:hypothetical protein
MYLLLKFKMLKCIFLQFLLGSIELVPRIAKNKESGESKDSLQPDIFLFLKKKKKLFEIVNHIFEIMFYTLFSYPCLFYNSKFNLKFLNSKLLS